MKLGKLSIAGILVLASTLSAQMPNVDESQVYKQYSTGRYVEIYKPYQSGTISVGIQSKGKLANVITDFGQLGQFHVFTPAFNWPAYGDGQDDEQHYGWGTDFMVGYQGDVIESFQDPASNLISRDWQRADENLFSGNVTVSERDLTPIMATSDNPDTWPLDDNGNAFWPGPWRQDNAGIPQTGEFTSERDLYTVFTDAGNDTPYGLRVELTAYSFTRRYAEDFLVYRFNMHNTSGHTLQALYPGMLLQFLIDFDFHDMINFVDSNNDGQKDLVYMWDTDGLPQDPWQKVGYVGLVVVNSPQNKGITNFHYFHDDFIPSKDEDFWTLLTSDTTNLPDTLRARFFHGSDTHIDDVAFAPDLDPEGKGRGGEVTWAFSCGPVDLAAGDSLQMDIAVVMGDDEADLLSNVQWVWDLSGANWNGPNPPASPVVSGFSGDGKAVITWDTGAETSRDNVSGEQDFEGYRIYRSTDNGRSWGQEITDAHGRFTGYVPLAQFDAKNEVTGYDEISGVYLGNDSGLRHTFIDTTVVNGVEYWYSVTAYDKGVPGKIESLESSFGLTEDEVNICAVIPEAPAANVSPPRISGGKILQPDAGLTDGTVEVEILDPSAVKDRNYKITFNKYDEKTTFTLRDADSDSVLLGDADLSDASGDNIPIVDGFRLHITNTQPGVRQMGWTKVAGDTCTFDWRAESIEPGTNLLIQGQVETIDDWRITVDYNQGTEARWIDLFTEIEQEQKQHLPIKVHIVTDPANPIDASADTWLGEFAVLASWEDYRKDFYSQLGWDLVPGGLGYLKASPGWYEKHVDVLILEKIQTDAQGDTIPNHMYLFTNNKPDTSYRFDGTLEVREAHAPSQGDEFTIYTNKPFSDEVVYTFSTAASIAPKSKKSDIRDIRVVPNPYFVSSSLSNQVMFTHLPAQCRVDIYNVAGDRIRRLRHNGGGTLYWDLKNDEGLDIAYGLYVYVAKVAGGAVKTGKFSIIR